MSDTFEMGDFTVDTLPSGRYDGKADVPGHIDMFHEDDDIEDEDIDENTPLSPELGVRFDDSINETDHLARSFATNKNSSDGDMIDEVLPEKPSEEDGYAWMYEAGDEEDGYSEEDSENPGEDIERMEIDEDGYEEYDESVIQGAGVEHNDANIDASCDGSVRMEDELEREEVDFDEIEVVEEILDEEFRDVDEIERQLQDREIMRRMSKHARTKRKLAYSHRKQKRNDFTQQMMRKRVVGIFFDWISPRTIFYGVLIFFLQAAALLKPYWGFTFAEWDGDPTWTKVGKIFFLFFASFLLCCQYATDRLFLHYFRRFAKEPFHWTYVFVFPAAGACISSIFFLISPAMNVSIGTPAMLVYSQINVLPVVQWLAIAGISGLYFVMSLFSSAVSFIWIYWSHLWKKHLRKMPLGKELSEIWKGSVIAIGIIAVVIFWGSLSLSFFSPEFKGLKTVNVVAVTPAHVSNNMDMVKLAYDNIRDAREVALRNRIKSSLFEDSRSVLDGSDASLVFWSEAPFALYSDEMDEFFNQSKTFALENRVNLVATFLEIDIDKCGGMKRYGACTQNSLVMINKNGALLQRYNKRHIIPGRERYVIPGSDHSVPVMQTDHGRVAAIIGYDVDFPFFVGFVGRRDIDLLLVPSADWKDIHYHTQYSSYRCVENSFSMIRQASSSMNGAFDYQSRILALTDQYYQNSSLPHYFHAAVPVRNGWTLYRLVSESFGGLCFIYLVIFAVGLIFQGFQSRLPALTRKVRWRTEIIPNVQIDSQTVSFLRLTQDHDSESEEEVAWNSMTSSEVATGETTASIRDVDGDVDGGDPDKI